MSVNLRKLEYSPTVNPLIEPQAIKVQRRYVRTRSSHDLLDPKTGEISGVATIHIVEERDDAEFVKVFADGVKAAFGLTLTGSRVFQAVLDVYQNTAMRGGYAESVELFWFDGKLDGRALDMSEKTFQRGLKELLEKGFLYPRAPSSYWVNPALFFKGDRVAFVKEYVRRRSDDDREQREAVQVDHEEA
ncbi:replication/maintenance protein RepL [Caballeronia concitans]|uniref:Firmicute plasmid replication protein (RepL) n=1 Tax=Caballeronia concitans TaxID=1777133 RepID=A0A658R5M4_9BURK|nr:replication/maintenance protein RepL [Caballeronia concitans]SAL52652.1 Firmicute plasmid replication protein (RepL) [Caballeronia concitans]